MSTPTLCLREWTTEAGQLSVCRCSVTQASAIMLAGCPDITATVLVERNVELFQVVLQLVIANIKVCCQVFVTQHCKLTLSTCPAAV